MVLWKRKKHCIVAIYSSLLSIDGLRYIAAGGPLIPVKPLESPLITPITAPFMGVGLMEIPFFERRNIRTSIMKTTPKSIFKILWSKEKDQRVNSIVEIPIGMRIGIRTLHLIFLHIFETTKTVRKRHEIWLNATAFPKGRINGSTAIIKTPFPKPIDV